MSAIAIPDTRQASDPRHAALPLRKPNVDEIAVSGFALPAKDEAIALLRNMQRIRAFEEQVRALFAAGLIPGLVHLCTGQEAVAVGVCSQLRTTDKIASNHRGHGHCLAKGADMRRLLAEIMGRRPGYGIGRGGSLHIFDAANGNLGTNGIVGGGIPLAAGAALSAKRGSHGDVAVCFFGDGALNQGLLFETLNMAAIWRLPAIFVCENNGYGEFTASEDVTAGHDPKARGAVFDMPSEIVDGMDVLAVRETTRRAISRARQGEGPSFLVCNTYRYSGHHVGDKQEYKNADEAEMWRQKDPIERLSRQLLDGSVITSETLAALRHAVEAEVSGAVEFARAAAMPEPQDLELHVHA